VDYHRVTEIYVPGTRGTGSGYLVGSGLVLTALHVIGQLGANKICRTECWIRPLGPWNETAGQWLAQGAQTDAPPNNEGWLAAELCWPPAGLAAPVHRPVAGYSRAVDLALLRVIDKNFSAESYGSAKVEFGLAGFDDQIECRAVGFPQVTMRTIDGRRLRDLPNDERRRLLKNGDLIADSFEMRGTIQRATALKDYQFHVHVKNETPDEVELWRGLSGAALFDSDERIIGVLAEFTSEFRNGALVAEAIGIARGYQDFIELLEIDRTTASLDRHVRQFLPVARQLAEIVQDQSERAFGRSLLSSLLKDSKALSPSKIFVRPEFRRKQSGPLLVPRDVELNTPLDLAEVIVQQEAVLVIGEPGSGKSFAAADLARRMSDPWMAGQAGVYVPIFMLAKDIPTSESRMSLDEVLASAFRASSNQGTFPDHILDLAANAKTSILLIVDGVDEIIGDEKVRLFLNWINSTVNATSGRIRVVLFTRPLGLDPIASEINQFSPFLLSPFDSSRRRELAQGIFCLLGSDEQHADKFITHVESLPIASLLDNPAIVTMLAIVSSQSTEDSQPQTRSDVISRYIKLLCQTFRAHHEQDFTRYIEQQLYGREFLMAHFINERDRNLILSIVGFWATDCDSFDRAFFDLVFMKCKESGLFSDAKLFDTERYSDLLKQFLIRIGILTESLGRPTFSHNLIREYLAASQLASFDGSLAELWLQKWRAPRWRETLLMTLPLWLRRPEAAECVLPRLRSIAMSSYDGSLFAGEALLELLPISESDQDLLVDAALKAVRGWNICENLLLTLPNANPSGLIRRLLLQPTFRSRIIAYLNDLHSNHCPLSITQLVRLLSDLGGADILHELAKSGTPFIRAHVARALLDCGDQAAANSAINSVLTDHAASIRLCRQMIDALVDAEALAAISDIATNIYVDTSVRINAAAHLWRSSPSDENADLLAACFFGTAHTDDVDSMVLDALAQSEVLSRPGLMDDLAPVTVEKVARMLPKPDPAPPVQNPHSPEAVAEDDLVSAFPKGSTADLLDKATWVYEANPSDEAYRVMIDAELADSRSAEPRFRAAYFVSRCLYYAGRVDLLRKRLANPDHPPQAGATALEMLARLGDSETVLTLLNDKSLAGDVLSALPEALELVGLQEHVPEIRSRIVLSSDTEPGMRERHFRPLLREDPALAERVAIALVDDRAQPREVRRWPLIFMAGKSNHAIDELADYAAQDPACCESLLYDLAHNSPNCNGAARAVVRATSPAPIAHLHVLDRILEGSQLSENLELLLQLAGRVDFNCEGHASVLSQLLELVKERPEGLTEEQRHELNNITTAKLSDPRATSLSSAAVLLWHLGDQASWENAFIAAVESVPERYGVLTSVLSIPVEIRTALAQRLAGAKSFDARLHAAVELCEMGLMTEGNEIFGSLISQANDAEPHFRVHALYDSTLMEAITRFSLEGTFGKDIAAIFATIIRESGAPPVTQRVQDVIRIVLRFATTEHREEIGAFFHNTDAKLPGCLWDVVLSEEKGDFYDAVQKLWFIILRVPDQEWLRQSAFHLALKLESPGRVIRLLIDDFSYFRRKNDQARTDLALGALKSLTDGRTYRYGVAVSDEAGTTDGSHSESTGNVA
jgi:hypothetical protein